VHVMQTGPARIIETLPIALPYPRGDQSFDDPTFKTAQQRLRSVLIESHRGRPR
jgi:NitT/TauT family transport system ATP-binding protein